MLSAIIIATDTPERPLRSDAVTRCLASLIDACIQGVIADATLVGAPGRLLNKIADDAGCGVVETEALDAGVGRALEMARHDHAFLLSAEFAVAPGFADEIADIFIYGEPASPRALRVSPTTLATRLVPSRATAAGIVAPRPLLLREHGRGDIHALARRLARGSLTTHARRLL
jgi:hypothetical protein